MGRIFISHSSADDFAAIAFRDWLVENGWDDVFLDIDPSRGILAGERWERRLYQAANRCEAVLFLISRSWLGSEWCLREYDLAVKLNKRVFGILIEDIPIAELPARISAIWQIINLAEGEDHKPFRAVLPSGAERHVTFSMNGLRRLKGGLEGAGLDPRFFAWPPVEDTERAPYRGLLPLEAEDAGIFFGREAPIISALDQLRGMVDAAPPRFLAILGASGSGKSSFLRAGLLPRLARDDRHYITLPPIRPERRVISGEGGLIRSLEVAFKDRNLGRSRKVLRDAVDKGAPAVLQLLAELSGRTTPGQEEHEGADAPRPAVILPIDQGEELFGSSQKEADSFLPLLSELLLATELPVIVLMTIRSDGFERLQAEKALAETPAIPFNLPPLPRGAYQMVIEGPARRLKDSERPLKIEPALTLQLLKDIDDGGAKDSLPLLAFTLERLYLEHGGDGDLRLSEYRHLGGIRGSIEAAVERVLEAADSQPSIPQERAARLLLLRRALIPWLVGIDPDTLSARRLVARLSEIPTEARPLVDLMVAERLLATDVSAETGEVTVEPAHEALLRQWGLLQGWLEEDIAVLSSLETVRRAARDWAANDKDEAWLVHQGGRLDDAEALLRREDLAARLEPTDRDYLTAARAAETERQNRELQEARRYAGAQRQVARRTMAGALVALLLAVVAGGAGYHARQKSVDAERLAAAEEMAKLDAVSRLREARVNQARFVASEAGKVAETQPELAQLALLEVMPEEVGTDATGLPLVNEAVSGLSMASAFRTETAILIHPEAVNWAAFDGAGKRVVTASNDGRLWLWDTESGALLKELEKQASRILFVAFSPDGKQLLTVNEAATFVLDAETGEQRYGFDVRATAAGFSPDGKQVVTGSGDGTVQIWDLESRSQLKTFKPHFGHIYSVSFSPDGKQVLSAGLGPAVVASDVASGALLRSFKDESDFVKMAAFSTDGTLVVVGVSDGRIRIFNNADGSLLREVSVPDTKLNSAAFSPDARRVIGTFDDNVTRIWDVETGVLLQNIRGHQYMTSWASFSPDGRRVVTSSWDKTARLWDVEQVAQLQGKDDETDGNLWAAFSPDSRRLATASLFDGAYIWDVESGRLLTRLEGHTDNVNVIAFSPDGRLVVTGSDDLTARIWDASTGECLHILTGHTDEINFAAFSPDGLRIITGSDDFTARVWDVKTGTELLKLADHEKDVTFAAFDPSRQTILTMTLYDTLRTWNAQTGDLLETREPDSSPIVFSKDLGTYLSSNFRGVALFDSGSFEAIQDFERKQASGQTTDAAAFSPDERMALVGSFDGDVEVWDIKTGSPLQVFKQDKAISFLAFSPDGRRLLTIADYKIKLRDASNIMPADIILAKARLSASRLIDLSERESFYLSTTGIVNAGESSEGSGSVEDEEVNDDQSDITQCDIAAQTYDNNLPVGTIDRDASYVLTDVIGACELLVAAHPDKLRYLYQLGIATVDNGDTEAGLTVLRKAAEKGYPMAFYTLAGMYRDGEGVAQDAAMARDLLTKAADAGLPVAFDDLAQAAWDSGDEAAAVALWRRGAALGDAFSHDRLGWVLEVGRGGEERDSEAALLHYGIATRLFEALGDVGPTARVRIRRASLALSLDPRKVAALWPQIRDWRPQPQ